VQAERLSAESRKPVRTQYFINFSPEIEVLGVFPNYPTPHNVRVVMAVRIP
jgi:hypothetical protein